MALIKLNNRGVRNVSAFGSVGVGSMVFIKKLTASSSGTLSFVDGASSVVLDSTYKEYLFTFNNIHPSAKADFTFNMSIDSGSNYNVTKTTTYFHAAHDEADSATEVALGVSAGSLGQSTGFQLLGYQIPTGNDECGSGYLRLFNPSSTTFVKHFITNCNEVSIGGGTPYSINSFAAGYGNTTSAVDAVQFKMSTGNIDAGDICLYGIK